MYDKLSLLRRYTIVEKNGAPKNHDRGDIVLDISTLKSPLMITGLEEIF